LRTTGLFCPEAFRGSTRGSNHLKQRRRPLLTTWPYSQFQKIHYLSNNAHIPFNHLILDHKDREQEDKTRRLYYNTDFDGFSHHTSKGSIHRPSMLQQMAQSLSKLHSI
jgi:hypothetical protein